MRKKINQFVVSAFLIGMLNLSTSFAQDENWQQMNGPYGGYITCLASSSNGFVAAGTAYGGLYCSTDSGDSWQEVLKVSPGNLTTDINGKMYASSTGCFYISADGLNWEKIIVDEYPDRYIGAIAFDPENRIYIGGTLGLYRSDDEGKNWVYMGLKDETIRCLAASSDSLIYVGCDYSIYRSEDSGVSWTSSNLGYSSLDTRSIFFTKSGYVLASCFYGVFRQKIDEDTWEKVLDVTANHLSMDSTGVIYLGSESGMYKSVDEGATWKSVNNGLVSLRIPALATGINGIIYAGTMGMGVFRSLNYGATWEETNSGLDNMPVSNIVGNSLGDLFAGSWGGGIQKSNDGGNSWQRIAYGLDPEINSIKIDFHDRIFITNRTSSYMSRNHGASWKDIGPVGRDFQFLSDGGIIAVNNEGIMISDSSGMNWNSYLYFPDYLNYVSSAKIDGKDTSYACTSNGLYTTTDKGATWEKNQFDTIYHYVWYVKKSRAEIFFAVAQNDDNWGTRFYRSEDHGISWVESNEGMEGYPNVLIEDSDGILYVGTMGGGVFRSSTGGKSWEPFNNGLFRKNIYGLYIDKDGYLYAGSVTGGYYKKKGSSFNEPGITWEETINTLQNQSSYEGSGGYLFRIKVSSGSAIFSDLIKANKNSLDQNYPNPFSETSTIRYSLDKPGIIRFCVYNTLGQLVSKPDEGWREAGNHEIIIEGAGLPAGLYIYRLQTSRESMDRKFVIRR